MKKQFIIIFFLFIGYGMQSQVLIALLLGDKLNGGNIEFGLDGGVNFSSIADMDSNNRLNTFNLGFYFDIKMKNQWYFNTGVLVKSSLGLKDLTEDDLTFLKATTYDADGDYRQKMSYFLVPALAKYKFKNHMYVEAGPQFGLMYKAWIEFNSDIEGNTARIKENNKDMINRIDMGLSAGAGYRLLNGYGWTLGVRYYYGFINVYKDRAGTRNSSLFLKLNVPIGVSEQSKELANKQKAISKERKEKRKQAKKEKNVE